MNRLSEYFDIHLGYPQDDDDIRCVDCTHMNAEGNCEVHGGSVGKSTEACEDLELKEDEL